MYFLKARYNMMIYPRNGYVSARSWGSKLFHLPSPRPFRSFDRPVRAFYVRSVDGFKVRVRRYQIMRWHVLEKNTARVSLRWTKIQVTVSICFLFCGHHHKHRLPTRCRFARYQCVRSSREPVNTSLAASFCVCCTLNLIACRQIMKSSETGEPRYLSDSYELEGFELPVSDRPLRVFRT